MPYRRFQTQVISLGTYMSVGERQDLKTRTLLWTGVSVRRRLWNARSGSNTDVTQEETEGVGDEAGVGQSYKRHEEERLRWRSKGQDDASVRGRSTPGKGVASAEAWM